MLLHYFGKSKVCNLPGLQHCTTSWAGNTSFMLRYLCLSNSPGLIRVYYKIWDVIQQRVYQSRPGAQRWRTEDVKLSIWRGTEPIIENAVAEWRDQLWSRIRQIAHISNCCDSINIHLAICHAYKIFRYIFLSICSMSANYSPTNYSIAELIILMHNTALEQVSQYKYLGSWKSWRACRITCQPSDTEEDSWWWWWCCLKANKAKEKKFRWKRRL